MAKKSDQAQANGDLTTLLNNKEAYVEEKLTLNETYAYNNVMYEMLRDTGIKTKVIKEYLPVINKLVNQYLQTLDFFVHFNLDESFSRKQYVVAIEIHLHMIRFSEGEKQRIDLALLFAWRQIAKMKNSVATKPINT